MFTVILKSKEHHVLAKSFRHGNEGYLIQEEGFQYLSELSECDVDAFSQNEAGDLITELNQVLVDLIDNDDIEHVNKIIRMLETCISILGSYIVFTPFEC